jgi:hypothetical protein
MATSGAQRTTRSFSDGLTITAEDGIEAVTYRLASTDRGLYVERLQVRRRHWRVVHNMLFDDEASFVRWSESQSVKFKHPLAYSRLQRDGCALLHARH